MYTLVLYALAFLLSFTHALPLNSDLKERDVYNPPITVPNAQTVWQVGSRQTVTWETANIPPDSQLTNPRGRVLLGWMTPDSMNLQINAPLAEGFMLRDGQVEITVPDFPPRDNYIVVLMGDSGNSSPEFRIEGGTPEGPISSPDPAPSPAPTSSPASSSPTLITDPIPITGTTITGTLSESPEGVFTSSTADSEISTPPVESTSISVNITPSESESAAPTPDSSESTESSSSSSTSSSTGTAEAANSEETPSSAAWSGHHISAKTIILGMATFSLALVL